MSDRHYILLFILLFPALALAQTINFEKDRVAYRGKIEFKPSSNPDTYKKAKEILLNIVKVKADSLRENGDEKVLLGAATMRLPSSKYHEIKTMDYRVKLKAGPNVIGYEIGDIRLTIRERGKKEKTLRAEEILKGIGEHGRVAIIAEQQLNEIDMHLQKLIALMQSQPSSDQASTRR